MAVTDLDTFAYVPLAKAEPQEDGSVIVYGKPSDDVLDVDRQIADPKWLREALPKWFHTAANVREMHQPKAVGKGKKLEWDEEGDPWLTAKIIDPDAVRKIREGVYTGFSIGIRHPEIKRDPKAPKGRIVGGEIVEVSVVDRPAVPTAKFEVLQKLASGEWQDCQTGKLFGIDSGFAPYDLNPVGSHVPGITGEAQPSSDRARDGNVHDPAASNSVDFDSLGNPILQPGHVRSNEADISLVTMDDRGAVFQVGDRQYVVPYTVESDGSIHWYTEEMRELPLDPKAVPDDPRASMETVRQKGAGEMEAPMEHMPGSAVKRDFDPDVGGGVDRDKIPAHDFVDPERRRFPIVTPKDVADAVHSYGRAKPPIPYEHFRKRLEEIAHRKGKAFVEALPKEWRDEEKEEDKVAKSSALLKRAKEEVEAMAFCPKCQKVVKCVEKLGEEEEKSLGGKSARYKAECGHEVRKFQREEAQEAKAREEHGTPEDHAEGAAKGAGMVAPHDHPHTVPTGQGATAGTEHGNARGEGPGNNPGEKREEDILRRLEAALQHYRAVQAEEMRSGAHKEGEENRALAEIKELVDALISNQEWERVYADEHELNEAKNQPIHKAIVDRAAELLVAQLTKKSRRAEHIEKMREAHKRLGDLIEELHEDPLAHHERGVAKYAGPSDERANPEASRGTQERNAGGPAPVNKGKILELIREQVAEIGELARLVAEAEEDGLVHGVNGTGSHLTHGNPVPPEKKPGGDRWDFTAGDFPARPERGGKDVEEMHKAVAVETAKAVAAEIKGIMEPLMQRLERVEHMARPARPPVDGLTVAEPTSVFDSRATSLLTEDVRQKIASLPPKQQDKVAALLIQEARKGR